MGRARFLPRVVVVVVTVVGVAWLLAASGATGAAHRPVSPRLLRYLSQGPIALTPAGPRARPGVSAAVASRDAARDVQWRPASDEGASLVRLGRGEGVRAGTLAWVVALRPRHPVYDGSCGKPANYVVAFIAARDGRFVGDAAGYNPAFSGGGGGCGWAMGELGPPAPRR